MKQKLSLLLLPVLAVLASFRQRVDTTLKAEGATVAFAIGAVMFFVGLALVSLPLAFVLCGLGIMRGSVLVAQATSKAAE